MLESLPNQVKIVEVGPRDGLQNEAKIVPTADKIQLIEALAQTGLSHIEITSFVSPKWIPQLADGAEVASGMSLPEGVHTSALVPNMQGYEAAKKAGLPEIAVFMSATESHSKKNINKSIAEALAVVKPLTETAKQDGKRVRAYLSVVFACPYEGVVKPEQVLPLLRDLVNCGVDELSLGDTIGAANPKQVLDLLSAMKGEFDFDKVALHFHDTRGLALVNVMAGLSSGITIFDASMGGMGGCPYAPGASGNLATEDLVYLLDSLGVKTGVNLDKLVECGRLAERLLNKTLPGRYLRSRLAERALADKDEISQKHSGDNRTTLADSIRSRFTKQ
jgi:hydroxymethylglutaryl-CoA lyase